MHKRGINGVRTRNFFVQGVVAVLAQKWSRGRKPAQGEAVNRQKKCLKSPILSARGAKIKKAAIKFQCSRGMERFWTKLNTGRYRPFILGKIKLSHN